MYDFRPMLNWQLKSGSHDFPGPDGGTCINEAAIVAAGFPYHPIGHVAEMPPCFSQILSQFALILNDDMPSGQRQRLIPYVTRLAGTADTHEVERKRASYLAMKVVNVFLPKALDAEGASRWAQECRDAATLHVANRIMSSLLSLDICAAMIRRADRAVVNCILGSSIAATIDAAMAMVILAGSETPAVVWGEALAAFDGVLAIGKQAEPVEPACLAKRLDEARQWGARAKLMAHTE